MSSDEGARSAPRSRVEAIGREVLIVSLAGRSELCELVGRLFERGTLPAHLVLDMSDIPRLDAAMLAELAAVRERLREHATGLSLWRLRAQPERRVRDSTGFHVVTTLAEVFPLAGEESATAWWSPSGHAARRPPAPAPGRGRRRGARVGQPADGR